MQERLQKIIAKVGIASRRKAEDLIDSGCVTVNGRVVTTLGTKADLSKDHIRVNGRLLHHPEQKVYLLLHKPKGYITSLKDPQGRPTVMNLFRGIKERVYPVGRLDYDTEGLLILTNDGEFAHLLMHPRHEIPKTYLAKVKGRIPDDTLAQLARGVRIRGEKTAPAGIKKRGLTEKNSWIEVTLREGRNRQVKRMFEKVGHMVIKLKRISYGPLSLQDLPVGGYRYLTRREVESLKQSGGTGFAGPSVGRGGHLPAGRQVGAKRTGPRIGGGSPP